MDYKKVVLAIENLEAGLHKYETLITQLQCTNVASDTDFQRTYNGFFRMQRRTPEFYSFYFSLLEAEKGHSSNLDFSYILKKIYEATNRVEASFSSKMLSIIDPHYPVWDKYVLQNLGLKAPHTYCENRITQIVYLYHKIIDWYQNFMGTAEAIEIIERFNNRYPSSTAINNIKKIDLVLWQMR